MEGRRHRVEGSNHHVEGWRHRVEGSLMMRTVTLLTTAAESHRMLRVLIHFHVIVAETSIATMQSKLLASLCDTVHIHNP